MNRKNFWIHLGIALVIVSIAAMVGQIRKWSVSIETTPVTKKKNKKVKKPLAVKRSADETEPEVLVRFRSDVDLAEIKKIAAKNNDRIEDEIETVNGLVAIDDLDDRDAKTIAEKY